MPGNTTKSFDNGGEVSGAIRDGLVQQNNMVSDLQAVQLAFSTDAVLNWTSGGNSTANPLTRGSTDTRVGIGGTLTAIGGVPAAIAGSAAGTAFGALGTIPASTWGIIALDIVAAGTVTFVSGAANYTTGYATEAAAIAALPYRVAAKARLGYVTILASASGWVAGTDALAGGATGNPATTTNYYPVAGLFAPTGSVYYGVIGGADSVLIPTVMARGSTDTRASTTAFTYNANGIVNLAKTADTTGTAFGALGTIPADKWGCIIMYIDATGTKSFGSAPLNYASGYADEASAKADALNVAIPSGKCRYGVITIKTKVGSTFVVGTDALAGGATGNPASVTNYWPASGVGNGVPSAVGFTGAQIGNMVGTALNA